MVRALVNVVILQCARHFRYLYKNFSTVQLLLNEEFCHQSNFELINFVHQCREVNGRGVIGRGLVACYLHFDWPFDVLNIFWWCNRSHLIGFKCCLHRIELGVHKYASFTVNLVTGACDASIDNSRLQQERQWIREWGWDENVWTCGICFKSYLYGMWNLKPQHVFTVSLFKLWDSSQVVHLQSAFIYWRSVLKLLQFLSSLHVRICDIDHLFLDSVSSLFSCFTTFP